MKALVTSLNLDREIPLEFITARWRLASLVQVKPPNFKYY